MYFNQYEVYVDIYIDQKGKLFVSIELQYY